MFSFSKLLNAMSNPGDLQAQRDADKELSTVERGEMAGGFVIPAQAVRDLTTASGSGAGVVQEDHMPELFVESLLAMNHASSRATRYTGLSGQVEIPAEDDVPVAQWKNETTAPTQTDPTFRTIILKPKKLGTFVDFSRATLVQATPDLEDLIRFLLRRQVARSLDAALMFGTGTNDQPTGMSNLTGKLADITLTAANSVKGKNIYAALCSAEQNLADNNINESNIVALLSPKLYYSMRHQAWDSDGGTTTADSRMAILPDMDSRLLQQYEQVKTGALTTAQGMFLADFSECIIGQWSDGFEIMTNIYDFDKEGIIRITISTLVDIQFKHNKAWQQIVVS